MGQEAWHAAVRGATVRPQLSNWYDGTRTWAVGGGAAASRLPVAQHTTMRKILWPNFFVS